MGTTCALCHSAVDDSFAPGIGRRLDGWPNLDLDPGAIIALSPALTDANERLHAPSEVVSEPKPGGVPSYAERSATKLYRTTPLRALAVRGPYFHNGVAATLEKVVERYNSRMGLNLSTSQKSDLVKHLKSL